MFGVMGRLGRVIVTLLTLGAATVAIIAFADPPLPDPPWADDPPVAVVNFDRTYVEFALGETDQFGVSVDGLPESGFGFRLQLKHTDNLEVSAPACGGLFNGSLQGGAGETEGVIDIECTFEHEQLFAPSGRMLLFTVARLQGGPGWIEFTSEAGPKPIIYSTPAVRIEFGGALQIAESSRP